MEILGIVVPGHGIASGLSKDSPYRKGSIEMQVPYFRELGLDISGYHYGTLNISIYPKTFTVNQADHTFRNVAWAEGFPPEDFSFVRCELQFHYIWHQGYVYYPHPETKPMHFQSASVIEIITEFIPSIGYDDEVTIRFDGDKIQIN